MANACDYNCTALPDHEQIQCGAWLKGGISAVAFIDCSTTITDFSDAAQWTAAIAAGEVKIANPVKASMPEGSAVEGENPNGCGAATIVDTYDRSVEIKDFNVTASNIDFYNQLNQQKKYLVLYQGCDGADRIWVIDTGVVFNARNVIPENNREKQMFMITGTWTEYNMPLFYDAPVGIFS